MTIFSKILSGEIPCHRVYEDAHVLAFLDIGPVSDGHLLVIPKEAKAHLHELSDDSAAAIGRVLPRLARAVMAATGATAYNILQNNGAAAHQAPSSGRGHRRSGRCGPRRSSCRSLGRSADNPPTRWRWSRTRGCPSLQPWQASHEFSGCTADR